MPSKQPTNQFVQTFDLDKARQHAKTARTPQTHQVQALGKLRQWFEQSRQSKDPRGTLLVLPTGGGKTFTAVRFVCEGPLSAGYKVLWLAHTHHLLEQAYETLGPHEISDGAHVEVSAIREPRETLSVRVVSGMPGHAKLASLSANDDFVIGSLPTIAGAYRDDVDQLLEFLRSAEGKLFVVFDEAHHAPAPSYARFVDTLRQRIPGMAILGLTATPVYADKLRKGWLGKLFPQGIAHQTTAKELMAAKILAQPVIEQQRTHVEATFDERKFARWSESYGDLPSDIVETLAKNSQRNDMIVNHYVANRDRFGKTIIFADRWWQCEYMKTALVKRGVRADVMYSHVESAGSTIEARNRRTADDNTKAIRSFNENKTDVLINVRMLTEGTDVPDVQTVFLTRQTTSNVLLTQMIGRALRGPAFKGTDKAFVVSFIDDWKQLINWAEFSLEGGAADDSPSATQQRLPVQLVSIELVRRLSAQMYEPNASHIPPFLQMLPIGWYRVEFTTQVDGTDNGERVSRLVLVYDQDREGFEKLQSSLAKENLDAFIEPTVTLEGVRDRVDAWIAKFFAAHEDHVGGDLAGDVFHIARHMAQSLGEPARFFSFDERSKHDLDQLAGEVVAKGIAPLDAAKLLLHEYARQDRFWRALYPTPELFRRQFGLIQERIIDEVMRGGQAPTRPSDPIGTRSEQIVEKEPPEEMKLQVKERDGWKCLCCGADDKKHLQTDHIRPLRGGGKNELANLQTLCRKCNNDKGVNDFNYLQTTTGRLTAHPQFEPRLIPSADSRGDRDQWARCVRATLNHYYQCAAVSRVDIGARGDRFYEWVVQLNAQNDPRFLESHLQGFLQRIRALRSERKYDGPGALRIEGSDPDGRRWITTATVDGGVKSEARKA